LGLTVHQAETMCASFRGSVLSCAQPHFPLGHLLEYAISVLSVHFGCALLAGDRGFEHQQFPLLGGFFRGHALVRSNGAVKRLG